MTEPNGESFRWSDDAENGEDAATRFPPDTIGLSQWHQLVELAAFRNPLEALDGFFSATAPLRTVPRPPRLFVSHQKGDAVWAERVAYLATEHGLQYWLDIHDPALIAANRQPATGLQQAVLVAGLIEMALLNCTCVAAVHTLGSRASAWIPYEFGRVKLHRPVSWQACGWFHPAVQAGGTAEYFELGVKTFGEGTSPVAPGPWTWIRHWLDLQHGSGGPPRSWSRPVPPALP